MIDPVAPAGSEPAADTFGALSSTIARKYSCESKTRHTQKACRFQSVTVLSRVSDPHVGKIPTFHLIQGDQGLRMLSRTGSDSQSCKETLAPSIR